MKTLKYLMMVAIALLLTACGGQTKTTNGADEAKATSVESSEDLDAILDSYEACVTEYVEIAEKASKGDLGAISELTKSAEKLQEISGKLTSDAASMTPEQAKRLHEITQKMTDAAQSLNK